MCINWALVVRFSKCNNAMKQFLFNVFHSQNFTKAPFKKRSRYIAIKKTPRYSSFAFLPWPKQSRHKATPVCVLEAEARHVPQTSRACLSHSKLFLQRFVNPPAAGHTKYVINSSHPWPTMPACQTGIPHWNYLCCRLGDRTTMTPPFHVRTFYTKQQGGIAFLSWTSYLKGARPVVLPTRPFICRKAAL